jgi:hypothetical protein
MATTLSAQESFGTIDKFIEQVGAAEKRGGDALLTPGSAHEDHKAATLDVQPTGEGKDGGKGHKVKHTKDDPPTKGPKLADAPIDEKNAFDLTRFAMPTGGTKQADAAFLTPGSAAADHDGQADLDPQPTGEGKKTEPKSGKEDPGTAVPARTDNESLNGGKYAADALEQMPLEELAKLASDLNNDFCAAVSTQEPTAAAQHVKQASAAIDPALAHQAGWEMAGLATGTFDKQAADNLVRQKLSEMIKTAAADADNVNTYLSNFRQGVLQAEMQKQAEGAMPPDPSMPPPPPSGDPGAGAGGPGGPSPMGAGAGGGGDPQAMMAALQQGGGGAPGGMPGGAPGGDPSGGAGGVDPQVMELAQVLSQLGVTPEELEQAMAQEEGGGGGPGGPGGPGAGGVAGGDPSAGGGGPAGGAEPAKMAGDRGSVKRGNTREGVREYIQEVIGRSRSRKA